MMGSRQMCRLVFFVCVVLLLVCAGVRGEVKCGVVSTRPCFLVAGCARVRCCELVLRHAKYALEFMGALRQPKPPTRDAARTRTRIQGTDGGGGGGWLAAI